MRTGSAVCWRALALAVGLGWSFSISPVQGEELRSNEPHGAAAIYPRDAVVFGTTYSGWSAAWQQWAFSLPVSEHPLFDNGDCSKGQSGPVWFLGGKFSSTVQPPSSGTVTRNCTVPKGKALFFPVVDALCLNAEAEKGFCGDATAELPKMRAFIAEVIDGASGLQVTVDGKPVRGDLGKSFRVQSPVYRAVLPEDNLFEAIGEGIEAGDDYWGVDDGIYIMLEPLPPGPHTLRFRGKIKKYGIDLDLLYKLTVQDR